jgi:hypothetical protein
MLTLYKNNEQIPLQITEYYIRELASGLDEVIFDISIWDPSYPDINEEANIVDRADQRYLVKQIDGGPVTAKVICQLDLDEWRADMLIGYDSGSLTVVQQLEAVKPDGWTVLDRSHITIRRTLHGDYTPLQVCQQCSEVYRVYIRWDNNRKEVTIYPMAMGDPVGAFATRELNLREINYKGKSNNFATRLYAYGKDGLTLQGQTIHGQLYPYPYVDDNTYSSRVICAYWQDDRYTDVDSLYDDAVEKLAVLAVPERSYDCSIVDLQATNPELYGNLDFSLFSVATLIDETKDTTVNYQVVERHVWPYHPDRNDVIFDNAPLKITNSVVQIADALENPNSTFQQIQSERIKAATDWLLSGDGYVVARQGSDGQWSELLFMDTNDEATATNVLRINRNGLGFSTSGVNGPYTNAWTIDGQLVADFITAGTLTANLIKAGILTDDQGKFSLNMQTGELLMNDGTFKGKVVLGGSGSAEAGTVELYDANNVKTMTIDNTGLQFIRTIGSHEYKSMYGYMAPPINGTYVINGLEFLEDGALTASVELQSNSRSGGAFMFRILSMTSAQVYGEYNLVLNTGGRLALAAGDDLTINGTVAYTGWAYPDNRIRFINGIAVDVQ